MKQFNSMDILQKINELEKELKDSEAKEQEYHDKAIILRRKIGKLKTTLRDASEILAEEAPVEIVNNAADQSKQE
jgi:uncharacterized protein YnzC (UPF0291/DUF896 family)